MKTSGIHVLVVRVFIFILLLLYSILVFGQPDYNFTTGNLISGVDRQVGAQYRYNNVRAGVDAKVTINAISGITLTAFDGGGGFAEALQPTIDIPGNSSGYVEYRVDFYVAGTNLLVPSTQVEVPVTPIDVDGQNYADGKVNEFDLVWVINGFYMFDGNGNELSFSMPFGGTWIQGTNIATIDYAGIDTVVKRVMFTVMNASTTFTIFRVGATNTSPTTKNRLRSVYFKRFNYPNIVLPVTDLRNFTGNKSNNRINLSWELYAHHLVSAIELQKSSDGENFETAGNYFVTKEGLRDFSFDDAAATTTQYYRLKMISVNGQATYSHVLSFPPKTIPGESFDVYPTLVAKGFTATIHSSRTGQGWIDIIDLSGKLFRRENIHFRQGQNSFTLQFPAAATPGSYVVVLRTADRVVSRRIIKG